MTPPDPDLATARALLGPTLHDPLPRARRVAGLYAALYLEDPLLHQWAGLAAFVADHLHQALEGAAGAFEDFIGQGNLDIYEATLPAFLRLRAGAPPRGPLAGGFERLARADALAATDLDAAEALAAEALAWLARVEQEQIVQPAYARLGPLAARGLAPLMRVRLGLDRGAPVFDFDGRDPRDATSRVRWAEAEILPAWAARRRTHPGRLRADLDRIRRAAGVRAEDLPPRPR